jgi:hypothetical protein
MIPQYFLLCRAVYFTLVNLCLLNILGCNIFLALQLVCIWFFQARYKMLLKYRPFFSVLLCQAGLNKYAPIWFYLVLNSWFVCIGCYLYDPFPYLAIFCCQISTKFLKADKKTADLVGNEKMKASTNVRHIILPCNNTAMAQLIPDIIRCYSRWFLIIHFVT